MEENIEKVMQAVCAAEGQAAVLLVTDDEPATTEGPREVLTVSSLKFEPTLQSAAYSSCTFDLHWVTSTSKPPIRSIKQPLQDVESQSEQHLSRLYCPRKLVLCLIPALIPAAWCMVVRVYTGMVAASSSG
ncbi:hypothetical protein GN958_ATG11194 [Phytophthora infestans]|uniref:Uncharacterized protein n=1 Tax=Phytophthora infestans TaxID=4787 RepID=A0A8S9UKV6_PHYIN|nr:hypothetical protein GN958_ATG11194 [Phytophthora infestans]